jgi:hypothetical protein
MQSFKDAAGRDWHVAINVAAVKRVKAARDIDLVAAVDPEARLLERLAGDPILLVDVLYVLCQPQAQAQNVSDEQFGEALWGESLDRAIDAFLEALTDFFPQARRGVLRDLLAKWRALETKAAQAATTRINGDLGDRLLAKELAKLDREIERTLASSGD